MGTNEHSQPTSKSYWDSQDFGDVNMVVKMAHFDKSSRPQWVKSDYNMNYLILIIMKPKFTSEFPKREVANHALWKIYAWFCMSRAKQRLCDVIMIPVSLNLHKIWTQICLNGKSYEKSVL